jgi:hypothetical protein
MAQKPRLEISQSATVSFRSFLNASKRPTSAGNRPTAPPLNQIAAQIASVAIEDPK